MGTGRKRTGRKKTARAKPAANAEPRRTGRPKIEIDLNRYRELCGQNWTDEEKAAELGISAKTIQRRRNSEPEFAEIEENARLKIRGGLRAELYGLAMRANSADPPRGASGALIFLCKQPLERGGLGMSDRISGELVLPQLDVDAMRELFTQKLEALARRWAPDAAAPATPTDEGGG